MCTSDSKTWELNALTVNLCIGMKCLIYREHGDGGGVDDVDGDLVMFFFLQMIVFGEVDLYTCASTSSLSLFLGS